MQHAGKVLTHKFLLHELWDEPTDTQYLRVYVRSSGIDTPFAGSGISTMVSNSMARARACLR